MVFDTSRACETLQRTGYQVTELQKFLLKTQGITGSCFDFGPGATSEYSREIHHEYFATSVLGGHF